MRCTIFNNLVESKSFDINKMIVNAYVGQITVLENHSDLITDISSCILYLKDDIQSQSDKNTKILEENSKEEGGHKLEFEYAVMLIKKNEIKIYT